MRAVEQCVGGESEKDMHMERDTNQCLAPL